MPLFCLLKLCSSVFKKEEEEEEANQRFEHAELTSVACGICKAFGWTVLLCMFVLNEATSKEAVCRCDEFVVCFFVWFFPMADGSIGSKIKTLFGVLRSQSARSHKTYRQTDNPKPHRSFSLVDRATLQ